MTYSNQNELRSKTITSSYEAAYYLMCGAEIVSVSTKTPPPRIGKKLGIKHQWVIRMDNIPADSIFKQQIIWHKSMVLGMSHYHWEHEPVIYCSLGTDQPPFYGDRTDKTVIQVFDYPDFNKLTKEGLVNLFQALKSRSTIFYQTQRGQEYEHPTQKPVGAMAPFIKNSSRPDEIVVDLSLIHI